ncbi:phosphate ABC transporter substrate-binding protein [Mycoplasma sp. P36-A1]|uniref:phosphate ABC transporter substrate-binding protein n=1 Tax=Mycoplasma sp. P36-A1 TaxID=3252900 RepID=UPI003C308655
MKKFKLVKLLCFGLIVASISACSSSAAKLTISGSTSMAPLMEKLTKVYSENSNEEIVLSPDGSSAGIKAAIEKVSDIGMSSRPLTTEELQSGVVDYKVAIDAIGVVVNNKNSVKDLSMQQLHDIFSKKIVNWKELGGEDLQIVLVSRESGSGTKSAFEETLDLIKEDKSSVVDSLGPITANSTGAVIENVSQKEGAIGYISVDSVDSKVKLLSIDKKIPAEKTISDGKYPLSRDFHLVYKEENKNVSSFIEYLQSNDGQEAIKEAGFVPVKAGK